MHPRHPRDHTIGSRDGHHRAPGAGRERAAVAQGRAGRRPAARATDAHRPPARLDRRARPHRRRRNRAVLERRVAHRPGHPDLRREALRPPGLAGPAQRRVRGQPGLRAGGPPAAVEAAHGGRPVGVRVRPGGLARRVGARGHDRDPRDRPGGPAPHPLHAARRPGRRPADRRRRQPRVRARRHDRHLPGAVRAARVRGDPGRPRRRAGPARGRRRGGPHRADRVRAEARRAVVAPGRRRVPRAVARDEVVGPVLHRLLRRPADRLRHGRPAGRGCRAPVRRHPRPRRRAGGVGVPRRPGAVLPRELAALDRQRDRHRPARRRPAAARRRGGGVPARLAARAGVLQHQGAGVPRHARHPARVAAPLGVQALDVADGAAPDALLLRVRHHRGRLRRSLRACPR